MENETMKMEDIQKVALNILKQIASVCEREGFRYTLAYGTLIGAIRHKGFIPWDDDIDIQMPRPDYERFIRYIVEHPLPNLKTFNHKYVKGYPLGISRIADMRYKVEEKITKNHCDMGIFVDVYPIDGLANTYETAKKAYSSTDRYRANLLRIIDKQKNKIHIWQLFTNTRYFISNIIIRVKGLDKVQDELEKAATKKAFEDNMFVGIPNWNWIQLVYKRKWFEEFVKAPFEDSEFFISKYYDDILRAEYGDYMLLPPIEKRVYHHGYIAYKRTNDK